MRRAVTIIYTLLVFIMLMFSLGTVLPVIPAFGSVANFVTVAWMHIWLPLNVFMFLLGLLLCRKKEKGQGLRKFFTFLAVTGMITSVVIVLTVWFQLRMNKLGFTFWPQKEDISSIKTETFTYTRSQSGDVLLNVYAENDGKTGKPVMVYIHGGGWINGSREDHEYYSKVFAKNGYVVVSVDYDLSSEKRHLATSTEDQVIEAFYWVNENIANHGGNPEDLYVTGGSAGGSIALDVSYRINSGDYSVPGKDTALPRIKAVSVNFPVCSVKDFYYNEDMILGKTAQRMAFAYTGCSPKEDRDLYASLEPITHLTKDTPATCVFYGANDTLVPVRATEVLGQTMKNKGYEVWLVAVPFGNHMYEMVDGGFGSSAYIEGSLRWFEEHR